ncbi:helix-turn-helix domain-containing protein [Phaeobacter sp. PT47_59]|uniref:helix-turn-helix domain-containing protein n=1 Tax=Phaeobacter sp. PT47_59 TaxID=3029979 RepID=UPI00237FE6D8|nr:helix-turn-helix domain-containing protein [Phaeobacter sp. PT47_59]MDE4175834.1 helix-turn-helix domain-containing protein [Phaeobacter sp. PT47_59]
MIGRLTQRKPKEQVEPSAPKGFDDFELRLGDMMRGERATMGKSLLDVQRELRIKASYIAAIENSDPSVFDTPGFIAGYVRSYARYLNMDPEQAFVTFCKESGFTVAHGMSAEASVRKAQAGGKPTAAAQRSIGTSLGGDPFTSPNTPFAPSAGSIFSHIELRAVGSLMVLGALIGGIGYGGWSILKEVQQVQFAPVDQTPLVLADVDPLDGARLNLADAASDPAAVALDRLYRPQALDVPILEARDAPIATLDPRTYGNFAEPELPSVQLAEARQPADSKGQQLEVPQVVEQVAQGAEILAVRPAWVEVTSADGSVIFEGIMEPGDSFKIPLTEVPSQLKTGESSGIYFAVNGAHFGPVGQRGRVTKNIDLSPDAISTRFEVADLEDDRNRALASVVAQLRLEGAPQD